MSEPIEFVDGKIDRLLSIAAFGEKGMKSQPHTLNRNTINDYSEI